QHGLLRSAIEMVRSPHQLAGSSYHARGPLGKTARSGSTNCAPAATAMRFVPRRGAARPAGAGTGLALPFGVSSRSMRSHRRATVALAACAFAACMSSGRELRDAREPVEELVEANPDIAARDLYYGVGGAANVPSPDAAYRFIEKKEKGVSTNLVVEDPSG